MATKDPEKIRAKQKRADEKRRIRARGWACIVYPESAPSGWVDELNECHLQVLISPLHDADVNADGQPKKAHYHVMVMFEQPVPMEKARATFGRIGVTAPPEILHSIKAYARYLVHMDDHDKHRYSEDDVTELGGASWAATALDEGEERDLILNEIEDWIDEQGTYSYRALCRYARHERPDWVRVVRTSTIHLTHYLRSAEWEDGANGGHERPQDGE